jgi:hypothetical protein
MNILDRITSDLLTVQRTARDAGNENVVALVVQLLLKVAAIPSVLGVEPEPEDVPAPEALPPAKPVEHMTDKELDAATKPATASDAAPTVETGATIPSEPNSPLSPQPAPEEPPVVGPTPAMRPLV